MKCIGFALIAMVVSAASFAISPISGSPKMCVGISRTLSDATPGGTWSSSNTLIATVSSSGAVTGVAAGTSVITYSATAGYATLTVTVNDLPNAYAVTGGGSYCAGDTGVHIGLAATDVSIDYTLSNGPLIITSIFGMGTALDFGLQTMAGTYSVLATNTATTCTAMMTGTVAVSISPMVVPSVSISVGGGDTVCAGTSSIFTAIGSGSGSGSSPYYSWMVNGTLVGRDTSAYVYTPANGDIISVTMASSAACASPDTVSGTLTITVVPHVTPYVNLSTSPGDTICFGYPLTTSAVAAYGGSSPAFWWVVNGVNVGAGLSYTYSPTDGDTIYCGMASNYFCRLRDTAYSPVVKIKVDTASIPYLNIAASPGYTIRIGQSDTLIASVSGVSTPVTYKWIKNTMAIPGATDSVYISNSFGGGSASADSITCIVTTNDACRVTVFSWAFITVSNLAVQQFVYPIENLYVSPNPGNGLFTLHAVVSGPCIADVEVFNTLGQSVYRTTAEANRGNIDEQLDLGNLPGGVYFLQLKSGGDKKVIRLLLEK